MDIAKLTEKDKMRSILKVGAQGVFGRFHGCDKKRNICYVSFDTEAWQEVDPASIKFDDISVVCNAGVRSVEVDTKNSHLGEFFDAGIEYLAELPANEKIAGYARVEDKFGNIWSLRHCYIYDFGTAPKAEPVKVVKPAKVAPAKPAPKPVSSGSDLLKPPSHAVNILPDSGRWKCRYDVKSESTDKLYRVSFDVAQGCWVCSCPGNIYKGHCKHTEGLVVRTTVQLTGHKDVKTIKALQDAGRL